MVLVELGGVSTLVVLLEALDLLSPLVGFLGESGKVSALGVCFISLLMVLLGEYGRVSPLVVVNGGSYKVTPLELLLDEYG